MHATYPTNRGLDPCKPFFLFISIVDYEKNTFVVLCDSLERTMTEFPLKLHGLSETTYIVSGAWGHS